METMIEAIRVAVQGDASDEAKHQGALACRAILTALDAKPGEPLGAPSDASTTAPLPAIGPPQVAAIISAFRGMDPERLLDLAIARLRAALPADSATPAVAPVRFQILPIGPLAKTVRVKGGGS